MKIQSNSDSDVDFEITQPQQRVPVVIDQRLFIQSKLELH